MEATMRTCGLVCAAASLVLALGGDTLRGGSGQPATGDRIAGLIKQLGDDNFARREAASRELAAIGEPALAALRQAAASSDDLETRRRAEQIVREVTGRALARAAQLEFEALRGTWYSASTEAGGVRQSGENKADQHSFTGDQWVCKNGEAVVQAAMLRVIEVGDKLVKIDFVITEGFQKGDTWVGIYERSGDELKWCGGYVGEGRMRPTTMATRPGDGYFLRSLKRVRK
jgi:uncharacterized protein (TIGR03067 family)